MKTISASSRPALAVACTLLLSACVEELSFPSENTPGDTIEPPAATIEDTGAIVAPPPTGAAPTGSDAEEEANGTPANDDITLHGQVGAGIAGAMITVTTQDGIPRYAFKSDERGLYRLESTLPRDDYPLVLNASGGTDPLSGKGPTIPLRSAVARPGGEIRANINATTTLIVEVAKRLDGGITEANLEQATRIVLRELGVTGLYGMLRTDPFGAAISENTIHIAVKSHAAVSETIDRTKRYLAAAGTEIRHRRLVELLAADLSDGRLGPAPQENQDRATDLKTTLLIQLVSGQVAIESLGNTLTLAGEPAQEAMDETIVRLYPGAYRTTDHVLASAELIAAAKRGTALANSLIPNPQLDLLESKLNEIRSYSNAITIRPLLPDQSSGLLTAAIEYVASASEEELRTLGEGRTPAPQEPAPQEPAPQEPAPQEPAPQEPAPQEPAPQEPAPQEPAPQEPAPQEPAPQEPAPQEPAPQEPEPNDLPAALDDRYTVYVGEGSLQLGVLENDSGLGDGGIVVSIETQPSRGTAFVDEFNDIVYRPTTSEPGDDRIVYRVTDRDGDSATATVFITIECGQACTVTPGKRTIRVTWSANTEPNIDGYYVHIGASSGRYDETRWVGNVTEFVYEDERGGPTYFAVTAVNTLGIESPYSEEAVVE